MATEVLLHVYDVTNSMNVKTNNVIVQLNKIMRDGIGLGGIFHGAIQLVSDGDDEEISFDGHSLKISNSSKSRVFNEEWSFGYCEDGSGVFCCPPKRNPMYTYRETVPLGRTTLSQEKVKQILFDMRRDWQGHTYDLLARNCNHFCEDFCERLGAEKLPLWVNRFAKTGDAAVDIAGNTMDRLKQAKDEVVRSSRVAYRFLFGQAAATPENQLPEPDSLDGSNSSRRLSYSRTPSRHLGQSTFDSLGGERLDSESTSKVDQDRSGRAFSIPRREFQSADEEQSHPFLFSGQNSQDQSFNWVEESTSQYPARSVSGLQGASQFSSEAPKIGSSSGSFRANALAESGSGNEHGTELWTSREQGLKAEPIARTSEQRKSGQSAELSFPAQEPDYDLSVHLTGDPEFNRSVPADHLNEESPTVGR